MGVDILAGKGYKNQTVSRVFVADGNFFGASTVTFILSWTATVDLRDLPHFHINKNQLEEEG